MSQALDRVSSALGIKLDQEKRLILGSKKREGKRKEKGTLDSHLTYTWLLLPSVQACGFMKVRVKFLCSALPLCCLRAQAKDD